MNAIAHNQRTFNARTRAPSFFFLFLFFFVKKKQTLVI